MLKIEKVRYFHKWVGSLIAIFVCFLTASGILLNHSSYFNLYKKPIYSDLIASLYNIPRMEVKHGYSLGDSENAEPKWISQSGQYIFLETVQIAKCSGKLVGARYVSQYLAILCEDKMLLLNRKDNHFEQLFNNPKNLKSILLNGAHLDIQTEEGFKRFDLSTYQWASTHVDHNYETINAQEMPRELQLKLKELSPILGLHWERVLLDFHSGRLFGKAGVYLVDLVGVLIILLSMSGLFMALNRKNKKRQI